MNTFDSQSVRRIARTVRAVERMGGGGTQRRGKFDDLGMTQPTAAGQILVSVETAPDSGTYEWELRDAPATGTHIFMVVAGVADWAEVTEDFACPEVSS